MTSLKKIHDFVEKSNTYLTAEIFEEGDDEILLFTRDNGNVGDETHSELDVQEATRVIDLVGSHFNETPLKFEIECVDEWVHLKIELNQN